jgi:carbon monoxide dehydrogenase subunit G
MQIDSPRFSTTASVDEVYRFIRIPENLQKILPSDRIQHFESTDNDCKFTVQGGITISLVLVSASTEFIIFKQGEKSPFPFKLTVKLTSTNEGSEGTIHFNGEVSMFIAMVATGPLTELFKDMSKNIKSVLEAPK